jgi:hypothetical protein
MTHIMLIHQKERPSIIMNEETHNINLVLQVHAEEVNNMDPFIFMNFQNNL